MVAVRPNEKSHQGLVIGLLTFVLLAGWAGSWLHSVPSEPQAVEAPKQRGVKSGDTIRLVRNTPSCRDSDDVKILVQVARENDGGAIDKLLAADRCLLLKRDAVVFVERLSTWGTSACLRPRGEISCVWTPIDFLEPAPSR